MKLKRAAKMKKAKFRGRRNRGAGLLPRLMAPVMRMNLSRTVLLASVSAAALLMTSPQLHARPLFGAAPPSPSAAAIQASQTGAAGAAMAARRSQDSLKRAVMAIQAAQASQAAARDAARAALRLSPSGIPNGLTAGGLEVAPGAKTPGSGLWVGADAPQQSIDGDRTTVTIKQTQTKAALTWTNFNVSEKTDLTFNQQGHADWVVLNRALNNTAPSRILGTIKSDGTVLVINQNGIVFGGGAQVNVGSLIASTLEVGPDWMPNPSGSGYVKSTIQWRTQNFLSNGLLGYELPTGIYIGTGNAGSATFSAVNGVNNGTVSVDNGASITTSNAGLILLTAPRVINAGLLRAPQGQVILTAAELALTLTASTGTGKDAIRRYDYNDGSVFLDHVWAASDADVRGLVPLPQGNTTSNYYVWNKSTGVIDVPQGSIYLRSPGGTFAANKNINDYSAGGITLGYGAAYNDGTLSATTSVSRNGSIMVSASDVRLGAGSLISILPDTGNETIPQSPTSIAAFRPSAVKVGGGQKFEMEGGALMIAPSGNVLIGRNSFGNIYDTSGQVAVIKPGAEINVAGLIDVTVPLSNNQIVIDPAKKNELRDTPLYRLGFLNGAVIYLDPRASGVRDDGVPWIGSPLIDATAYSQLVAVGVDRLMVKGGNITIGGNQAITRSGAIIDMSGGWLNYEGGLVRTTQLIDNKGHVVDITNADPNGTYVGIYNGYVLNHKSWGIMQTWMDPLGRHKGRYVAPYSEGIDAGTLTVAATAAVLDATLRGTSIAGVNQIADAKAGSGKSSVSGDLRPVQGATSELPAGGALLLYASQDVEIAHGGTALPDGVYGSYVGGSIAADGTYVRPVVNTHPLPADRLTKILISDDQLSDVGLSQVSVLGTFVTASGSLISYPDTRTSSGRVMVDNNARIALNPGGVFQIEDTRIQIDGDISVPSGKILLRTDPGAYASTDTPKVGDLDIVINGDLSVAGRWVNDYGAAPNVQLGSAWLNGGTISMTGAPTVQARDGTDISGSILIGNDAHLNLSSGGRIDPTGKLVLAAKGGNLTLAAEAAYFRTVGGVYNVQRLGFQVFNYDPDLGGTPINPTRINARVVFNLDNIEAHGFGGGGTFTLTAPEIKFGADAPQVGAVLPLDFFSKSGFANFNITSYKTALIPSRWVGYAGTDAVLAMQTLTIGAGQTLSLVQSVLPTVLDATQQTALRALQSGGDLRQVLSAYVPTSAYEQKPVNLTLGGMVELRIAQGGSVVGAAGSSLTVGGLLNEGTIRLVGGTVAQQLQAPYFYSTNSNGIRDYSEIFTINPDGSITPTAASKIKNSRGVAISNQDLVAAFTSGAEPHAVYFLGALDQGQGIVLAAGSVTDLSGAVLMNPLATSTSLTDGRIVGGGSISSGAAAALSGYAWVLGAQQFGQQFIAQPGAVINVSGAAGELRQPTAAGLVNVPVWSDAGTVALGAGGTLTGATIVAQGGNANARGGTLQIYTPVFSQHDPATPTANVVSADMISAAGFDTVVAVGRMTSSGDATIALDRAFLLVQRGWGGQSGTGTKDARGDFMAPIVSTGGALTIAAPYIGLQSNVDDVQASTAGTAAGGSVTFRGQQIDVVGAVRFDKSVTTANLWAAGDVRLIGVDQSWNPGYDTANPTLLGRLIAQGDVSIIANQVYPTTGSTFTISSTATNGTISFDRSSAEVPAAPYTAGANLTIQAANVVQGGVIRVPFGSLTLGGNAILKSPVSANLAPATQNVTLTDGSITSVSAGGLSIPYGITTDTIEWYFAPTGTAALNGPPQKVLGFNGTNINLNSGATIDLRGGGDVYAYEFVPGTGGSRDVLSQYNSDQYSANKINGVGYQYPDGRQVYAIVPGLSDAPAATYDPIYSANYANLLSSSSVGRRVYLAGGNGLAAGWYTLLPAQYALLPGGMRVVEQTGAKGAIPGASTALNDGTVLVSGQYGDALSGAFESTVRQFSVQSQAVIRSYSNIVLTSGNNLALSNAASQGTVAARNGLDAGRLAFNPIATLSIAADVLTDPAARGRGSQVDISGTKIDVVSTPSSAPITPGAIVLSVDGLNKLKAESLMIGAVRTDNTDGTTTLAVTSNSIVVANDAAHPLSAAEIVFAVDDGVANPVASQLVFRDGAAVIATGLMNDQRSGAYIVDGRPIVSGDSGRYYYDQPINTAIGALVRVGNGPQRLVQRLRTAADPALPGQTGSPNGPDATLTVGNVNFTGKAISLDTSHNVTIGTSAQLRGDDVALGATALAFSGRPQAAGVVVITPELLAALAQGDQLTLRSQTSIAFDNGSYQFKSIKFDASTLTSLEGGDVTINAGRVAIGNSGTAGVAVGGTAMLSIAADDITINNGTMATAGFGVGVNLSASKGIFSGGAAGVFDVGANNLTITTPYIGDRGTVGVKTETPTALAIKTTGNVAISRGDFATADLAAAPGIPGSSVRIDGSNITVSGTLLRATAGNLSLVANGTLALSNGAIFQAPGYARTFGDASDAQTKYAPGGTVSLTALGAGGLSLGDATISVGNGTGNAGTLKLSAVNGAIDWGTAALDGKGGTGGQGGVFAVETGGAFDLVTLNNRVGAYGFTGGFNVRTQSGDLTLAAGQELKSGSVNLTADGGSVVIGGKIDVSGVYGGNIALNGASGVTLQSGSRLDAHADGYAADDTRQASAGNVTLGSGFVPGTAVVNADGSVTGTSGSITVAAGAVIDVSAHRPGDRLVRIMRNGVVNYAYVQGDTGGTVTFRAPVVVNGGVQSVNVNVASASSIVGARAIDLVGFKRWDLAGVAASNLYKGVAYNAGTNTVTLDLRTDLDTANVNGSTTAVGGINFLGDYGAGSVVQFAQDLDLSASYGNLGGLAGQANFKSRPGIDLAATGDIVLASNWNLGAGTVDLTGATAAGYMRYDSRLQTAGVATSGYIVSAGSEDEIFANYTKLTYRPGRSVLAGAPVVSLLAGGKLNLKGSLTDGFFEFRDQTDQTFRSIYGATYKQNILALNAGSNTGGYFGTFQEWSAWTGSSTPGSYIGVAVGTQGAGYVPQTQQTIDNTYIPYTAIGNSPAALGTFVADSNGNINGGGDPMASAVVFPLLPDGTVVNSASYNLVAGAAGLAGGSVTRVSTDPTRLNLASNASLVVEGMSTYKPTGGSWTTGSVNAGLLVDNQATFSGTARPTTTSGVYTFSDWLAQATAATTSVKDTSIAVVWLGTTTTSPNRTLINNLFAAFAADHGLVKGSTDPNLGWRYSSAAATDANTTFIAMSVKNFKLFVNEKLVPNLAALESNIKTAPTGAPTYATTSSVAAGITTIQRTLIRTGTGSINMGATGNVDLTGGPVVYVDRAGSLASAPPNSSNGNGTGQVGGIPVYTAGHPAAAISTTLPDPVTKAMVAVVSPAQPTTSIFATPYGTTFTYGAGGTTGDAAGVMLADTYVLTGGGDISVVTQGSVLSRKDNAGAAMRVSNFGYKTYAWTGNANRTSTNDVGLPDQAWRVVNMTSNGLVNATINPQLFREGIGALGGGDVSVSAGGNVSDLTTVADASLKTVTTTLPDGASTNVLVTVGGGNIAVQAAGSLLGNRIQAASGSVKLSAGSTIGDAAPIQVADEYYQYRDLAGNYYAPRLPTFALSETRLYIDDATVDLSAGNTISIAGISQLSGFYSDKSALNLLANGSVTVTNDLSVKGQWAAYSGLASYAIYPGTLTAASLSGDLYLKTYAAPASYNPSSGIRISSDLLASYNANSPAAILLIPSSTGQLSLFAGRDINKTTIAMLDSDPYFLPGLFALGGNVIQENPNFEIPSNLGYQWGMSGFPGWTSNLTDAQLKRFHNADTTHAKDPNPVYIYAGRDIGVSQTGMTLWVPKQARVYAGRDILNMMFVGQNLAANDITRIVAGRDITATTMLVTGTGGIYPNYISRTAPATLGNTFIIGGPGDFMLEAGRTLGPFMNSTQFADSTVFSNPPTLTFPGGIVAVGNEWNPNLPAVSANLTVQFGVAGGADYAALREVYVRPGAPGNEQGGYSAKLIDWMKKNAKDTLLLEYRTTEVDAEQAYAAFLKLPDLRQRKFLLDEVYFNELRAPAQPKSPSYLKYSRGYLAVNTLFPASMGYTANALDGGVRDDSAIKQTGNLDLRLATIETLYGSNVDILGPGGRVLAGSVVATSQQAMRRNYLGFNLFQPSKSIRTVALNSAIPSGFEGVMTQRGGNINTFTDGDFLLNQSRLFTVQGGDITMWSSNADLNAGQGAKTTPNFPPVLVRINENLYSKVDRTGATTGAGIAAFPPGPDEPLPTIYLLAPRGTVDAGDASVRSAGDLNVAALLVANSDNFRAGGSSTGIPTLVAPNVSGMSDAGNAAGQAAKQAMPPAQSAPAPQPSVIIVEVVGFGGGIGDTDSGGRGGGATNGDDERQQQQ